jgi:hypothetical protein
MVEIVRKRKLKIVVERNSRFSPTARTPMTNFAIGGGIGSNMALLPPYSPYKKVQSKNKRQKQVCSGGGQADFVSSGQGVPVYG